MLKIFISEGVELKKTAKKQLKGNWAWAIGLAFISQFIIGFLVGFNKQVWTQGLQFSELDPGQKIGFVLCSTLIGIFISAIILWGVTYSVLAFRDDQKKKPNIFKATFAAFGNGNYAKTLKTSFLTNLFMTLWGILFIIPGIIKAYSYSLTPYIMKDMIDYNHEMTTTEAINESKKIMKGHKGELFLLDLSFIGWAILVFFPIYFGLIMIVMGAIIRTSDSAGMILLILGFVVSLWLAPYYRQTKANYYRNLVGDKFTNKSEN